MTISVGDRLPDTTFMHLGADGPESVSTADVFAGRKVAMFGVPGAFTPTCHNSHLPGFLDKAEQFRSAGIDDIVCLSVNDIFVMNAWADASGAKDTIKFLSDWNGAFANATGLNFDGSAVSLGTRLQRFSMVVDDGVVKALNIEDVPSEAEKSSAANLIGAL